LKLSKYYTFNYTELKNIGRRDSAGGTLQKLAND